MLKTLANYSRKKVMNETVYKYEFAIEVWSTN